MEYKVENINLGGISWSIDVILQSLIDDVEMGGEEWWRRYSCIYEAASKANDELLINTLDEFRKNRSQNRFQIYPCEVASSHNLPRNTQQREGSPTFWVDPAKHEEEWRIHDTIVHLVTRQPKMADILDYLKEMYLKGDIILPQDPANAYKELVRLGMSSGKGFTIKNFQNAYKLMRDEAVKSNRRKLS